EEALVPSKLLNLQWILALQKLMFYPARINGSSHGISSLTSSSPVMSLDRRYQSLGSPNFCFVNFSIVTSKILLLPKKVCSRTLRWLTPSYSTKSGLERHVGSGAISSPSRRM